MQIPYKISKSLKVLHKKILKVSAITGTILFFGFIVYLLLPPIIKLHTALDNQPKLIHKPVVVKNLKKSTSSTKTKTAVVTTSTQPQVSSAPVTPVAPPSSPTVTPKPIKTTVTPAPSSVNSLTPTSTSSSTSTSTSSSTSTSTSSSTSTSTSSSAPTSTSSSTTTGTPPPAVSYTSSNWSGYLSDNNVKYTSVSGQWVIPDPTGNGSTTTADASWVGIGGVTTSDLIQIGTEDNVTSSGTVYSAAFYEMLPNASIQITSLNVLPGDSISASIDETDNNLWAITITDNTTNQTYTNTVSYSSSLSSAEWIEEDPSNINGALMPLDNFGTVTFNNAFTTVNGDSVDLSSINADSITMINSSNQVIADPSAITANGSGFSVTRQN